MQTITSYMLMSVVMVDLMTVVLKLNTLIENGGLNLPPAKYISKCGKKNIVLPTVKGKTDS